ncbi:MAG: hypothetical protein AAGB32_01920 [Pseudomonadota bacterium]
MQDYKFYLSFKKPEINECVNIRDFWEILFGENYEFCSGDDTIAIDFFFNVIHVKQNSYSIYIDPLNNKSEPKLIISNITYNNISENGRRVYVTREKMADFILQKNGENVLTKSSNILSNFFKDMDILTLADIVAFFEQYAEKTNQIGLSYVYQDDLK